MRLKNPYAPIRLRELRLQADIGVKQLATQANVKAWIIYQTEAGNCNPMLHRPALKKVAVVLGTSLPELLKPATVKHTPSKQHPVRAGHPNLPAVIPKKRSVGRPPTPQQPGDVVQLSVSYGGKLIGGIETRDLGAMRRVLRDLFGGGADADPR